MIGQTLKLAAVFGLGALGLAVAIRAGVETAAIPTNGINPSAAYSDVRAVLDCRTNCGGIKR